MLLAVGTEEGTSQGKSAVGTSCSFLALVAGGVFIASNLKGLAMQEASRVEAAAVAAAGGASPKFAIGIGGRGLTHLSHSSHEWLPAT